MTANEKTTSNPGSQAAADEASGCERRPTVSSEPPVECDHQVSAKRRVSALDFEAGSFRDPETRVFYHNGAVLRCLTQRALDDWQQLHRTKFFARLAAERKLIGTTLLSNTDLLPPNAQWAAVLKHEAVPLVSYPYEWSFSMLKDAALLQLDVTLAALEEDMILKDATPFNVQWLGCRPTFIDIGSFTSYQPGEPWNGYRQFCELFLYPLLLQSYRNVPFQAWLRGNLEGITAEQIQSMLSVQDHFRSGVFTHVYLQAKAQARYERSERNIKADLRHAGFSAKLIKHNVSGLRRLVGRLHWTPTESAWSDYENTHNYTSGELQQKTAFIRRVLRVRRWPLVWDLGCNTGMYSRLASQHSDYVLALDADHTVVDRLYRELRTENIRNIQPMVTDCANPAPSQGWRGLERRSFPERGSPELILCLALIHHLVISRHVPLSQLIAWLAGFDAELVIEFIDHNDPKVRHLLRHRSNQNVDYSRLGLEDALTEHFSNIESETLESGNRILYYANNNRSSS